MLILALIGLVGAAMAGRGFWEFLKWMHSTDNPHLWRVSILGSIGMLLTMGGTFTGLGLAGFAVFRLVHSG